MFLTPEAKLRQHHLPVSDTEGSGAAEAYEKPLKPRKHFIVAVKLRKVGDGTSAKCLSILRPLQTKSFLVVLSQ